MKQFIPECAHLPIKWATLRLPDHGEHNYTTHTHTYKWHTHTCTLIVQVHVHINALFLTANPTRGSECTHTKQLQKESSCICSATTTDLSTNLRVDLHGEEEPEVGVRSERVELLLQLHQPLRSKMDVLQQHPATSLRGRGDGLLSQTEAFSRTWGERDQYYYQERYYNNIMWLTNSNGCTLFSHLGR